MDRDPAMFPYVLAWLRDGRNMVLPSSAGGEASFDLLRALRREAPPWLDFQNLQNLSKPAPRGAPLAFAVNNAFFALKNPPSQQNMHLKNASSQRKMQLA